jgi:hypothetical protein
MTKRDYAETILLTLMAGIGCLALWFLFQTVSQCNAMGGTTVRGLFWLECIK